MNFTNYIKGNLVDAHCHIDLMSNDVTEVENAESNRIHTIAVTNVPSVFFHTQDICKNKSFVHAALGLHPELVRTHSNEIKLFFELVDQTQFVGEIGLDYLTSDISIQKKQRDVFEAILQCCSDSGGRILSIHSRRSARDIITALEQTSNNKPILHWFSGSHKELAKAISLGCYFSVNPSMLCSASGLKLLTLMPRDRILTETDGPFVRVEGRPCTALDSKVATKLLAAAWDVPFDQAAIEVQSNFNVLINSLK